VPQDKAGPRVLGPQRRCRLQGNSPALARHSSSTLPVSLTRRCEAAWWVANNCYGGAALLLRLRSVIGGHAEPRTPASNTKYWYEDAAVQMSPRAELKSGPLQLDRGENHCRVTSPVWKIELVKNVLCKRLSPPSQIANICCRFYRPPSTHVATSTSDRIPARCKSRAGKRANPHKLDPRRVPFEYLLSFPLYRVQRLPGVALSTLIHWSICALPAYEDHNRPFCAA
jgi:hypothetical protein